jgi:hypothetical protein
MGATSRAPTGRSSTEADERALAERSVAGLVEVEQRAELGVEVGVR